MKHTPKPDGTRWETADGTITKGLKEYTGLCITDGWYVWANDGRNVGTQSAHHFPDADLDLVRPVTVTPLPDPEPEEPKPPKELWVIVWQDGDLSRPFDTEKEAARVLATDTWTGVVRRYVLPDEAERGFSEEEISYALDAAWQPYRDGGHTLTKTVMRAALNRVSELRHAKS